MGVLWEQGASWPVRGMREAVALTSGHSSYGPRSLCLCGVNPKCPRKGEETASLALPLGFAAPQFSWETRHAREYPGVSVLRLLAPFLPGRPGPTRGPPASPVTASSLGDGLGDSLRQYACTIPPTIARLRELLPLGGPPPHLDREGPWLGHL